MMRRRGGPGVVSTVARTAVIAGTATTVSNKVTASQMQKAQAKQAAAQAAPVAAAPAPAPAALDQQIEAIQAQEAAAALGAPAPDLVSQLTRLSELRTAGVLSDEEFAQAKARLLGN